MTQVRAFLQDRLSAKENIKLSLKTVGSNPCGVNDAAGCAFLTPTTVLG